MRRHKLPTNSSEHFPNPVVSGGEENNWWQANLEHQPLRLPLKCWFQPPFLASDCKAGLLPVAAEVGSRNPRWHFVQKGVRRKVSHLGFSYDPISTATTIFRIVGGKGYSPGDGDGSL